MLPLESAVVFLIPITSDGKDLCGSLVDGDDIGQRDPIFILLQIPIYVQLKDLIPLIIIKGIPLLFGLFLLNVREDPGRLSKLRIPVEPIHLQLADLIFGLAHYVGYTLCHINTCCPIRDDDVFCRDVNCNLSAQGWIEVNLLESRPSNSQAEQHPLMLRAVLDHFFRQPEVHIVPHPL